MKRTLIALLGVAAVAVGSSAFAADLRIGGTHLFVPVPRVLLPPPILLPPGVSYAHSYTGNYGRSYGHYDRWDNRRYYGRHDYERRKGNNRAYNDQDRNYDHNREQRHR
jgi:hypothetical protein